MAEQSEFEIIFASPDTYIYLVAEIYFQQQFVCRLSREIDTDHVYVEFIEDPKIDNKPQTLKFRLEVFLDTLNVARRELLSLHLSG
jgi:hypothetical protein